MAKQFDIGTAGIGDIDHILHNQGPISDYSWLSVNVEEYRAAEALPQQNLDAIPELSAALTYEGDERVPSLIPLRPHTIVNSNPLERKGPSGRPTALTAVRDRLASYVIANLNQKHIQQRLQSEFDIDTIKASEPQVREVWEERGLLGNVYINAVHFPRCAQKGPAQAFVNRTAKDALYVLAKDQCTGCVHNNCGRCGVFKKYIVNSVPYNMRTLAHYVPQLQSEGRIGAVSITKESALDIKKILQAAFLKSPVQAREIAPQTIQHLPIPVKPVVSQADYEAFWARQSSGRQEKMPSVMHQLASRRMMQNAADVNALRASSDVEIRILSREHGILGYTYLDVDALGGFKATLNLIQSKNLTPDFVLARTEKVDDDDSRVQLTRITRIVSSKPVIGKEFFLSACERAVHEKRMTTQQLSSVIKNASKADWDWVHMTAQANLHKPEIKAVANVSTAPKSSLHHLSSRSDVPATVDTYEMYRNISRMMNTGLHGRALQAQILKQYAPEDLKQMEPNNHQRLVAAEGIQGVYFIDPTVYSDYGKGCLAGSQHFRKRGASYLLASGSCTGCMHQTAPSWCNKYSKRMIRQIPDSVKQEILAARKLSRIVASAPVENPVDKFELSSDMTVDLNGMKDRAIEITVNPREIDQ